MSTIENYPSPPKQKSSFGPLFFILVILSSILGYRYWSNRDDSGLDPNAVPRPITARGDLAEDEKATIELFREAAPSVVFITTLTRRQTPFGMSMKEVPEGAGSGFLWDDQGHVVTNYHVIKDADAAQVTLADHSTWKAKKVGAYPDKDLAVLKISAPKKHLRPLSIGTSSDLKVGQKAFAIGDPFGLDQTLTTGIVSALGREIESVTKRPIKNVIQTNAAINPGNSGGPLLDSAGRLIGVNTAILSPSGASAGIGFAIPVDEVNRVVPQLIQHGKIVRPGLGIFTAPDQTAKRLGVTGVLIVNVKPNGPAAKAGLRPTTRDQDEGDIQLGDIIVAINGKAIQKANDLFGALEQFKVGDTVKITVLRDEKRVDVDVVLEELAE